MLSRRDFLKMLGAMGAAMLIPFDKIAHALPRSVKQEGMSDGEVYEGFVLLEHGEPVPYFVEGAPCPILGSLDETDVVNPDVTQYLGETQWFGDYKSLRENLDFHLFIPRSLPKKIKFLNGYILRFAGSGQVWEARLDYGYIDTKDVVVSVSARPVFPKPYPVWPTLIFPKKEKDQYILDEEYVIVKPEKVNFTPHKGILSPTENGFMLQWIKKDVLYTMFMEYDGLRDKAEQVGSSLQED